MLYHQLFQVYLLAPVLALRYPEKEETHDLRFLRHEEIPHFPNDSIPYSKAG